jgi:hypothetical protein
LMEFHDHTYMTARREPLYGYPSARGLNSHALSPSAIRHDSMSSRYSAVPAWHASGASTVQVSYRPLTAQASALPLQTSPAWALPRATAPLVAPRTLEFRSSQVGILETSNTWSPRVVTSSSFFTPLNAYSGSAPNRAFKTSLNAGAAPSWVSQGIQTSFASRRSLGVNDHQAVVVNRPYGPAGVLRGVTFSALRERHPVPPTRPVSLLSPGWRLSAGRSQAGRPVCWAPEEGRRAVRLRPRPSPHPPTGF